MDDNQDVEQLLSRPTISLRNASEILEISLPTATRRPSGARFRPCRSAGLSASRLRCSRSCLVWNQPNTTKPAPDWRQAAGRNSNRRMILATRDIGRERPIGSRDFGQRFRDIELLVDWWLELSAKARRAELLFEHVGIDIGCENLADEISAFNRVLRGLAADQCDTPEPIPIQPFKVIEGGRKCSRR